MLLTRRFRPAVRAAAALAATLLALSLAACGGKDDDEPAAADGPVTLQFIWWGNDVRAKATEDALNIFRERHKNITVKTSFSAFDAYFQKLSTQIAGGDAPDVVQMDRAYLREYAERNALLDLAAQMKNGSLKTGDLTQSLLPAGKVNGKTYAIPAGQNTQAVVYDPAAWTKAGVSAPSANWTWNDFETTGVKLSQSSGGKAVGFGDFGFAIDWFDVWLHQRGKAIFTDDGKLGFTAAELTDFWNLTAKMRQAGALAGPQLTTQQDGSVQNSTLVKKAATAEFNYDSAFSSTVGAYGAPLKLAPVPSDTDKRGMMAQKSMSFSVARSSKHPKEAAMLIDFLVNDVDAGKILGVNRGMPPNAKVRDAIAPTLSANDKVVFEYEKSVASLLLPTPQAQPRGAGPVKTEFQRVYDEVIFGRISVADGAKRLVDQAKGMIG